jgi:hypothetical protein
MHLAGLDVQGAEQPQGAVAVVLESMPLQPAARQGSTRSSRSLFIHAEDGRTLERIRIQADDIGPLAFEIRIVAGHATLEAVLPKWICLLHEPAKDPPHTAVPPRETRKCYVHTHRASACQPAFHPLFPLQEHGDPPRLRILTSRGWQQLKQNVHPWLGSGLPEPKGPEAEATPNPGPAAAPRRSPGCWRGAAGRLFSCSRNTVRKWLRHYQQEGKPDLKERSRAPRRIPHKTPPEVEQKVLQARDAIPCFGPQRLKQEFGLPSSTGAIGRILRRTAAAGGARNRARRAAAWPGRRWSGPRSVWCRSTSRTSALSPATAAASISANWWSRPTTAASSGRLESAPWPAALHQAGRAEVRLPATPFPSPSPLPLHKRRESRPRHHGPGVL